MPERYLKPAELVSRWKGTVNVRTLANWRSTGQGPDFVKIGGRVLYLVCEVERYETERSRVLKK